MAHVQSAALKAQSSLGSESRGSCKDENQGEDAAHASPRQMAGLLALATDEETPGLPTGGSSGRQPGVEAPRDEEEPNTAAQEATEGQGHVSTRDPKATATPNRRSAQRARAAGCAHPHEP